MRPFLFVNFCYKLFMKKINFLIFLFFILFAIRAGAAEFVAPDITPIRAAWLNVYEKLDKNKKGYLIKSDFYVSPLAMVASGKYFSIIDKDSDEKISKHELEIFIDEQIIKQNNKLRSRWMELDSNYDGKISFQESKNSFYFSWYFDKIDTDSDKFVTPQEFVNFIGEGIRGLI